MKKIGYIDGRRIRVGGMEAWGPVPSVLIPGTEEAYGIFEEFLGVEQLNVGGNSHDWEFWIQNAAVLTQADEPGGVGIITCGGTNNDSGQIILGALAGGGGFFPLASKHLWFEAKIRAGLVGPAVETNYFVGLMDPLNAAILADNGGALPNNILGFVKRDLALEVNWSFVGRKIAVEDMNPLGDDCVVENDWHTLGFYINGITNVVVYYDREVIADGAVLFANIPLTGLMPAIAVKDGSGAAETIEVDYVMCVQLR